MVRAACLSMSTMISPDICTRRFPSSSHNSRCRGFPSTPLVMVSCWLASSSTPSGPNLVQKLRDLPENFFAKLERGILLEGGCHVKYSASWVAPFITCCCRTRASLGPLVRKWANRPPAAMRRRAKIWSASPPSPTMMRQWSLIRCDVNTISFPKISQAGAEVLSSKWLPSRFSFGIKLLSLSSGTVETFLFPICCLKKLLIKLYSFASLRNPISCNLQSAASCAKYRGPQANWPGKLPEYICCILDICVSGSGSSTESMCWTCVWQYCPQTCVAHEVSSQPGAKRSLLKPAGIWPCILPGPLCLEVQAKAPDPGKPGKSLPWNTSESLSKLEDFLKITESIGKPGMLESISKLMLVFLL